MQTRTRPQFSLPLPLSLLALFWLLAVCSPIPVPLPDLSGTTPAPDLTLPTPAGDLISLSDFRGQILFVNFWATYCPPCVEEMPDLQAVHESLTDKPFTLLGVNVEESPDKVIAWTNEHSITFPQVISDDGTINPVLNLRVMPTTWFIDGDGILRGKIEGQISAETAQRIAEILLEDTKIND